MICCGLFVTLFGEFRFDLILVAWFWCCWCYACAFYCYLFTSMLFCYWRSLLIGLWWLCVWVWVVSLLAELFWVWLLFIVVVFNWCFVVWWLRCCRILLVFRFRVLLFWLVCCLLSVCLCVLGLLIVCVYFAFTVRLLCLMSLWRGCVRLISCDLSFALIVLL